MLAAMDRDTYADARGRAMVPTLLDSGLRASELCGLTLDELDLETGEVRVRRGKGGKDRHLAVGMRTRWRRCTSTSIATGRRRRCRRWVSRCS